MIDYRQSRIKRINVSRVSENRDVPYHRTGARFISVELVELIVKEEVGGGTGEEPTLMGVLVPLVTLYGERFGCGFVRDVHDGEGVFVVAEADFVSVVCRVGTLVDDALGVVDVTVFGVTTSKGRGCGFADIDHVKTGTTCLGTDAVRVTGDFVDGDVVAVSEFGIVGGFFELWDSTGREISTEEGNAR